MKKYMMEFIRRGLMACGLGPMVLAAVYLVLHLRGELHTLTVNEVCAGIVSLSALAFVAGGMNVVYQVERLPLAAAILIHGGVLYICYLAVYLLNGWLESGTAPILIFSAIFLISYLAIWAMIYTITRRNTRKLNQIIQQKQENA